MRYLEVTVDTVVPAILNAPPVSPWPPPFLYIPRVTQAMTPYDGDFSSLRSRLGFPQGWRQVNSP